MKNIIISLLILVGTFSYAQGSSNSEFPADKNLVKQYDLQGNCVVDYLKNETLCKELALQLENDIKLRQTRGDIKNNKLKELYTKAKLIAYSKGDYYSALKYFEKEQAIESPKISFSVKPEIEKAYLEAIMESGSNKTTDFKKVLENKLCKNLISTSMEKIENEIQSSYTANIIPIETKTNLNAKLGTEVKKEVELHTIPEPHVFQILESRMQHQIHLAYYDEVYKPVIHKIRNQKLRYQN